jgi:hypothetical protein
MTQIVSVVLAFVLTGLVGNALVQRWQHRSWVRQQQFLGIEKEYFALMELSTELANTISRRLYKTRRLLWAVRSLSDELMEDRLKEYDTALVEWNESLSAYYVRLTIYATYAGRYDLDGRIHQPFQTIGSQLETMVRERRQGTHPARADMFRIERSLNSLQAETLNFSRDVLKRVEETRQKVYFGNKIPYSRENLKKFSTWQLIKALFVPDVDTHAIFRSPSDPP